MLWFTCHYDRNKIRPSERNGLHRVEQLDVKENDEHVFGETEGYNIYQLKPCFRKPEKCPEDYLNMNF